MAADVQKQVDEVNNRIKGEKEEKNMIIYFTHHLLKKVIRIN